MRNADHTPTPVRYLLGFDPLTGAPAFTHTEKTANRYPKLTTAKRAINNAMRSYNASYRCDEVREEKDGREVRTFVVVVEDYPKFTVLVRHLKTENQGEDGTNLIITDEEIFGDMSTAYQFAEMTPQYFEVWTLDGQGRRNT